jgi:hypothetical protein
MTEILTESFCERCGTRYTFESAAPRRSRLGRVRTASKGLRNFVMQDESTFSEAMADARSEEERSATAHQLDAFHKTFNFCMTCRQYTCANCWNTAEGRCLTCSPIPGMELPEVPEPVAAFAALAAEVAEPVPDATGPEAWPVADLGADRLRALGVAAAADAVTDAVAEAPSADGRLDAEPGEADDAAAASVRGLAPGQSLEEAVAEYEMTIAAEEDAELEAEAVLGLDDLDAGALSQDWTADGAAQVLAEPGPAVVAAAAPEANGAAEPQPVAEAEPERSLEPGAVLLGAAALDLVTDNEPEPEPDRSFEPAAVLLAAAAVDLVTDSEPEAEPEPVAVAEPEAEPEPVAVAEPEAEPEPVTALDDVVPQPTWPVAATSAITPEMPAQPPAPPAPAPLANPWLTVAPDEGQAPQWPAAPQWGRVERHTDVPATLAGRVLVPQDDAAALWAASAREVLGAGPKPAIPTTAAPVTPQPCVSCGLSLSANARFCRRCGTRQA